MKFHEDTIFKNDGQLYGQELLEIINIEGKIIAVHQTEYSILDPKMYKPDLVFELEDRIVILEFQSSYINLDDKKRFRFYTALFDKIKNESNKDIEVHVLSTKEKGQVKFYNINADARFPIYIHSLKNRNGDKFLNNINIKIGNNEEISIKELLLISLLCFMSNEDNIEKSIYNSAITITNIPNLNNDLGQFAKGVILMLCDKFVKDELLNTSIMNLVGGNMQIVEDYADRKVEEATKELKKEMDETKKEMNETKRNFIINLNNQGKSLTDIAKIVNVDMDFVKKTLAQ